MSAMPDTEDTPPESASRPPGAAPGKLLSPAARRALEEAAERKRKAKLLENTDLPPERDGPKGEEPTRYGDWERGGIAYDF